MDSLQAYYALRVDYSKKFAEVDVRLQLPDGAYFTSDMDVNNLYLRLDDMRPLGDFFRTMNGDYHLSSIARDSFADFRFCTSIRWISVTVERRISKPEHYWLMHAPMRRKVLHPIMSDIEYVTGSDIILQVNRTVLERSAIPDFDAFRGERDWFVSKRLKNTAVDAKLTRMVFEQVTIEE